MEISHCWKKSCNSATFAPEITCDIPEVTGLAQLRSNCIATSGPGNTFPKWWNKVNTFSSINSIVAASFQLLQIDWAASLKDFTGLPCLPFVNLLHRWTAELIGPPFINRHWTMMGLRWTQQFSSPLFNASDAGSPDAIALHSATLFLLGPAKCIQSKIWLEQTYANI